MSTQIEFKINTYKDGTKIDLANLSLKAAKSLIVMLQSITKIAELSPEKESIRIRILEGSARVIAEGPELAMATLENDYYEVANNKSFKKDVVHQWRNLQDLLLANGFGYEVKITKTGQPVVELLQQIKTNKPFRVRPKRTKSDTQLIFLKGELIEIGGVNPNFHLHTSEGEKIIQCDSAVAIKIKVFLYKQIRLSVWCKSSAGVKPHYTFCDKYIHNEDWVEFKEFIEQVQDATESEEFLMLHDKLKTYLSGPHKSIGKVRKIIRLFVHPLADVGTLKAILVITKSFEKYPKLKDDREAIVKLIEKKTGQPLL